MTYAAVSCAYNRGLLFAPVLRRHGQHRPGWAVAFSPAPWRCAGRLTPVLMLLVSHRRPAGTHAVSARMVGVSPYSYLSLHNASLFSTTIFPGGCIAGAVESVTPQ